MELQQGTTGLTSLSASVFGLFCITFLLLFSFSALVKSGSGLLFRLRTFVPAQDFCPLCYLDDSGSYLSAFVLCVHWPFYCIRVVVIALPPLLLMEDNI